MRIVLGADHGGFPLKQCIVDELTRLGHDVIDKGTFSEAAVDYPDFSEAVGASIMSGEAERGILLCGSGVGASVAANKMPGVRCAVCHDTYSAHQGVEHDDMNVLCLGSEVIGPSLASDLVSAFLTARFDGGERYVARLVKVAEMEKGMLNA